jgi:hypothetical protein
MGNFAISRLALTLLDPVARYGDMETAEETPADSRIAEWRTAFLRWASGAGANDDELIRRAPHLRDLVALTHWPAKDSVRYYPLNFSQYGWLPEQHKNASSTVEADPAPAKRPLAMKLARDDPGYSWGAPKGPK